MMRKAVDDRYAVDLSFHFQPPLHAAKCFERLRNHVFRNVIIRRERRSCRRIPDVVFATQRKFEIRPRFSIAQHRPGSSIFAQPNLCDLPDRAIRSTVTLNWKEGFLDTVVETFTRGIARIKCNNPPASRNQVHQSLEGRFDRVEIFIDIRVVEFDRSKNQGIRKVVQKLWTLIEECGVILVAFENKVLAFAQPKTPAEIFRDTTDEERRPKASGLEDPSQHRSRSRLAMRSGYDENLFADQELIVQNLRQRAERNALVKHALQFDIAARKRVPHDHEIGTRIEVRLSKRLRDGNAQRFQNRRHRRIYRPTPTPATKTPTFQPTTQP